MIRAISGLGSIEFFHSFSPSMHYKALNLLLVFFFSGHRSLIISLIIACNMRWVQDGGGDCIPASINNLYPGDFIRPLCLHSAIGSIPANLDDYII